MIKHGVLVVKVFVHNAFILRKGIAGPNIGKRLKLNNIKRTPGYSRWAH